MKWAAARCLRGSIQCGQRQQEGDIADVLPGRRMTARLCYWASAWTGFLRGRDNGCSVLTVLVDIIDGHSSIGKGKMTPVRSPIREKGPKLPYRMYRSYRLETESL